MENTNVSDHFCFMNSGTKESSMKGFHTIPPGPLRTHFILAGMLEGSSIEVSTFFLETCSFWELELLEGCKSRMNNQCLFISRVQILNYKLYKKWRRFQCLGHGMMAVSKFIRFSEPELCQSSTTWQSPKESSTFSDNHINIICKISHTLLTIKLSPAFSASSVAKCSLPSVRYFSTDLGERNRFPVSGSK